MSARDHILPVYAKCADGKPITESQARELMEFISAHEAQSQLRLSCFAKFLKAMRMGSGYGAREFAERCEIAPASRIVDFEHARIEPTDIELQRIVYGLLSKDG